MPKCPHCGSTAQVQEIETKYIEDGWEITIYRNYKCGCGYRFYGVSVFHCQDQCEFIEEEEI